MATTESPIPEEGCSEVVLKCDFHKPYKALELYRKQSSTAKKARRATSQARSSLGGKENEEFDALERFAGAKRPMTFNRMAKWEDVERIARRYGASQQD